MTECPDETHRGPELLCPCCSEYIPIDEVFSKEKTTASEWVKGYDGSWSMAVYTGRTCPHCGAECTISMMCRWIEDIRVEKNPE